MLVILNVLAFVCSFQEKWLNHTMDLVLWAGKEVNQEDWSRWLRLVWKTWFIGEPVGFSGLANSLQSHNRNCITVCTQRRRYVEGWEGGKQLPTMKILKLV